MDATAWYACLEDVQVHVCLVCVRACVSHMPLLMLSWCALRQTILGNVNVGQECRCVVHMATIVCVSGKCNVKFVCVGV